MMSCWDFLALCRKFQGVSFPRIMLTRYVPQCRIMKSISKQHDTSVAFDIYIYNIYGFNVRIHFNS